MAIIKQGILGGFSGKVANVVGTSWKGIAIMKSIPLSVANPRTTAQMAQRNKFSSVVLFAAAILTPVIKPLWDRFAIQMSGYNAFVRANIEAFIDPVNPLYPEIEISSGNLRTNEITDVAAGGAGEVIVQWDEDSGSGDAFDDDTAYIVLVDSENDVIIGYDTQITRDAETATVLYPDFIATNVHCYLAFRKSDGTRVSNTAYEAPAS